MLSIRWNWRRRRFREMRLSVRGRLRKSSNIWRSIVLSLFLTWRPSWILTLRWHWIEDLMPKSLRKILSSEYASKWRKGTILGPFWRQSSLLPKNNFFTWYLLRKSGTKISSTGSNRTRTKHSRGPNLMISKMRLDFCIAVRWKSSPKWSTLEVLLLEWK